MKEDLEILLLIVLIVGYLKTLKNILNQKLCLGLLVFDTILNYLYKYKLNYNVINPVNSIISIHYHLEQ